MPKPFDTNTRIMSLARQRSKVACQYLEQITEIAGQANLRECASDIEPIINDIQTHLNALKRAYKLKTEHQFSLFEDTGK